MFPQGNRYFVRMLKNIFKACVSDKAYRFAGKMKMSLYLHILWPILYFGSRQNCIMCGKSSRKFLPVGFDFPVLNKLHVVGGERLEESLCPMCLCDARERLVYLYLSRRTNVFSEALRVLHIAPERMLGKMLRSNKRLDYTAGDLKPNRGDMKIDITDICFESEKFDAVICNHVLEHVPDDRKAMSEFFRVLKPGGWAILQVPISKVLEKTLEDKTVVAPKQREAVFGQEDHVRIYAKDYKDRLQQSGFIVETYNCLKEFGDSDCDKYKLIKEEDLFFCRKPG